MDTSRRRLLKHLGRFTAVVTAFATGRFLQNFFSVGSTVTAKARIYLGKAGDIMGRIKAGRGGAHVDSAHKVVLLAQSADPKKPEASQLLAVSLECTHLGCTLRPNQDNRYLECPCHGSRFAFREGEAADGAEVGRVLRGPANKDLKRYQVIHQDDRIYLES